MANDWQGLQGRLEKLVRILVRLSKLDSNGGISIKYAIDTTISLWCLEVAKLNDIPETADQLAQFLNCAINIKEAVTTAVTQSVFDAIEPIGTLSYRETCASLSALTSSNMRQRLLESILRSLENPIVGNRTKAMRALNQVVTASPDLLKVKFVNTSIQDRIRDSSPAVRDASIELISKYIQEDVSLLMPYYEAIKGRIAVRFTLKNL